MAPRAKRRTSQLPTSCTLSPAAAVVMTLSALSPIGCFGGSGDSTSASTNGHGTTASEADGSSGGIDGMGGSPSEPTEEDDCQLPDEDNLRIEDPENENEVLFNEVLSSDLRLLYQAVGKFASGDSKVLKGTASILDVRGEMSGTEDLSLESSHAVASFGYEGDTPYSSPYGLVLHVFEPSTSQLVRMVQNEATTSVCGVDFFYGDCVLPGTCSNCLPPLESVSDSLSLSFAALGRYGSDQDPGMRIDVAIEMQVVPPDQLTMDDLLILNSTIRSPLQMRQPELEGDTYLFEVGGSLPTSNVDEDGCKEWVDYEAEWFVRRDCLLDYGVREFSIVKRYPVCPPDQG